MHLVVEQNGFHTIGGRFAIPTIPIEVAVVAVPKNGENVMNDFHFHAFLDLKESNWKANIISKVRGEFREGINLGGN